MPEWSNGSVSKTDVLATVPRVRIPVSPPFYFSITKNKSFNPNPKEFNMKKVITLLFLFVISLNTLASNPRALNLLDNDKLISESKEITTEVFPDADDAIVDEHSLIRYNSDGTYEQWNERCLKVLTERGKRQNRTVSSFYNLFYSTATVEAVEIIKPDGTIIPIDIAKQSRQMIDRSQMGANIYDPNDKIIKVSVPGLEIGDMCKIVF